MDKGVVAAAVNLNRFVGPSSRHRGQRAIMLPSTPPPWSRTDESSLSGAIMSWHAENELGLVRAAVALSRSLNMWALVFRGGNEAGAPHAGARAAELEEAKGTRDDMNGVVKSAQARRVPAGPGFSGDLFCGKL